MARVYGTGTDFDPGAGVLYRGNEERLRCIDHGSLEQDDIGVFRLRQRWTVGKALWKRYLPRDGDVCAHSRNLVFHRGSHKFDTAMVVYTLDFCGFVDDQPERIVKSEPTWRLNTGTFVSPDGAQITVEYFAPGYRTRYASEVEIDDLAPIARKPDIRARCVIVAVRGSSAVELDFQRGSFEGVLRDVFRVTGETRRTGFSVVKEGGAWLVEESAERVLVQKSFGISL